MTVIAFIGVLLLFWLIVELGEQQIVDEKNWLQRRKAAADEAERVRGYEYAAGQLLLNGSIMLERLQDEASCGRFRTKFDDGILDAVQDYTTRSF